MEYIIFDDSRIANFYPLTLTRPVFDLRSGILKLRQRIQGYMGIQFNKVIIADYLESLYRERHPDWKINEITGQDTIFINSRLQINEKLVERINKLPPNSCLVGPTDILAARFIPDTVYSNSQEIEKLFKDKAKILLPEAKCWNYPWELITANSEYLLRDYEDFFYEKDNKFETELGITVINPYNLWIGEGTMIKPGVVIDAQKGPVVLDEEAIVLPNVVITGPVYIGKKSIIKPGSIISEGTSIGPVCKIGGEVENTIFQAYTNKQHEGYLGHSYLGEWINLGAGTCNSDLKNNYRNVRVYFYPDGDRVDTGNQFIGAVIADHTKTGINSSINTGTVIGVGCNLYGQNLIKDFVPSLTWGEAPNFTDYNQNKFNETAALSKQRRGLGYSEAEMELYNKIRRIEQTI
ncbi:MAG: hypothetical protein JXB60_02840 [Candidatus Cloacimonetes bacterium]|nr:hypothetical protein [Candidatus Cloacimonadota bacterium]